MALQFPEIDPIALHFTENFGIRWYALAYLAGILGGWYYALHLVAKNKAARPNKEDIEEVLSWLVMGIILGGRLGYVLFYNLPQYISHPWEVLYIWEGGMSFHGGLLGVVTAIVLYSRRNKFSILVLGDIISTVVPVGLFFGRIANFVNGELFGRVSNVSWAVVFPYGGDLPRHPSQLYEAFLEGLVLFTIMFVMSRKETVRKSTGMLTGTFVAGYGVCRFIIEFFREPDMQIGYIMKYFSMGQLLSLPMIAIGAYLIYRSRRMKTV